MPNSPDELGKSWKELSMYVLEELKRLNENCKTFEAENKKIIVDLAMLKVKAGVWGLAGGLIPVLVGVAIMYLRKGV